MRPIVAAAIAAVLTLAGCSDDEETPMPTPVAMTEDAIGHYCGMNVLEHPGPKGQIMLGPNPEPVWFSSARDLVAFTMLPEEAKNISALYVSDMAKAASWESPGANNWVEARRAFYVIGSSMRGGMGAPETVPFSSEVAAVAFTDRNGGEVVRFADIPPDYVLGTDDVPVDDGPSPQPSEPTH
ncbi:MAG: nitrous oxide reductase accessory protein NosL [Aurantimonas endophytica]|uniref:nitrous oxide reductase accessory protein NosL n=1 Tax=Aurantimonas endophytica TaxID=1522175 RepID=UPI0030034266